MDVGGWLKELGLADLAAAFEENGVDADLLPELTNEDLKDLGVARLRDRKRLLSAIAALSAGENGATQQPAPMLAIAGETERRHLSVMFVDLVGSTPLAERLDPEDMGEILRLFREACGSAVGAYGGFIANYIGDGILILFGYPTASEEDAARALHAGLAVVEAVTALGPRLSSIVAEGISVRVAIATGIVLVGALDARSALREVSVIGEPPNLAARLQEFAAPDTVVVSDETRRLVGGQFKFTDTGLREIRGFPQPVRVWRVEEQVAAANRFKARAGPQITALVGRQRELARVLDRWRKAKAAHGQVVLLSGEAGIGKSRICHALEQSLSGEDHHLVRIQCSPFHSSSALYPIVEHLRGAAGIRRDDTPEAKLDKLEALPGGTGSDGLATAQLFAQLLAIPTGSRYPPLELSAARQKALTLEALWGQIARLSAERPLAIVLEDAHWLDPTTQELLDLAVEQLDRLRILLVITHRGGLEFAWSGHTNVAAVTLNRLNVADTSELAAKVIGSYRLPDEVLSEILAKTDGIPLFIEELTKMLLDRFSQSGSAPDSKADNRNLINIPATIHDLLLARLDQIGPVKRLAQQAACFGRTFSHRQLATISDISADELKSALAQLTDSGLVNVAEGAANEYIFKHALIQDAAYESLLHSKRADIHKRIATAFEDELSEKEPEILAHHFGRAQLFEQEISYWRRAALKAMGSTAFVEAITYFRSALARLPKLPAAEALRQELELQVQVAVPLTLTRGWAAPAVGEAYERAHELCQRIGDSPLLFPALSGIFGYYMVSGNHRAAEEMAMRYLERAEQTNDPGIIMEFELHPGVVCFYTGRPAEALPHLERSVSLYDAELHREHTQIYGKCPATVSLAHLANSLAVLGRPEEAFACNLRSAECAVAVNHSFSQIWAMSNHAENHILYEDHKQCGVLAEKIIAAAEERGFVNWLSQGQVWLGWSVAQRGDRNSGLAKIREGMKIWDMTGAQLMRPFYFALLGECLFLANQQQDANDAINECFAIMEKTGEVWIRPQAEICAINIALERGDMSPNAARARLKGLSDTARDRGEWLWVLKAERQLLLNARAAGEVEDSAALQEVLGRFGQISPYPALREAAALTMKQTAAVQ